MIIDLLTAIFVSLGAYLGYQRGIIRTVFDTLSLIIGIIAALKLSPITIDILQKLLGINPALTFILGIAITFVGVMYLIRFIGRKLEQVLEVVHLNFVNKIAGAAIQGFFFATMLALAVGLVDKISLLTPETKAASVSYPHLQKVPELSQGMFNTLKPVFSGFWDKMLETIDQVKKK